jgi:TonB family protein
MMRYRVKFSWKPWLIAVCAISLAASPAVLSTKAQTVIDNDSHLSKAQEAIRSKKYDRAEDEVKLALKQNPESLQAKLVLVKIYRYKAKWREAFQLAFEALALKSPNPDARYHLAQLYYETEESGQAKKELDKAFLEGVTLPEAHALKAYMAMDEDNFALAIPALETALSLAAKNIPERLDWQLKLNFIKSSRDCRTKNRVMATRDAQPFNPIFVNYPREARKNKIEGSVNICALIDDKGKVVSWEFKTRLGYGTDEEAIKGLEGIQFIPAIKDGRSIPYWTNVEFVFRLP